MLNQGKHSNKHLQASWNKYGSHAFIFYVKDIVKEEDLLEVEKECIAKEDFSKLYNQAINTYGGGSEALEQEVYLLDLKGNVLNTYKSRANLLRILGAQYTNVVANTPRILMGKYRVVTPEFYSENPDRIKSWKPYTSLTAEKRKLWEATKPVFEVSVDGKIYTTRFASEVAPYLGITAAGAVYLLSTEKFQYSHELNHRPSGARVRKLTAQGKHEGPIYRGHSVTIENWLGITASDPEPLNEDPNIPQKPKENDFNPFEGLFTITTLQS